MTLLVMNGPNINFLGIREKEIYGTGDYNYLLELLHEKARKEKIEIEIFQGNSEGAMIDRIQKGYYENVNGIIINPGAYTHYSYAIRDAIASVNFPSIEVHISNIYQREEFRRQSVTAPVCIGQITGFGISSYLLAIDAMLHYLKENKQDRNAHVE